MFLDFSIKDIIDIVLVALLLYYFYRVMKESRTINVFVGIVIFVVVWIFVSQILKMKMLGSILDTVVSVGVIALIVLFQDEIRKFLFTLGAHQHLSRVLNFLSSTTKQEQEKANILPIVMACVNMSRQKTGALIVVERSIPLNDIIATGEEINAEVRQRLIENLFFKNSPLHDGAVVVKRDTIRAAGCILPVAHDVNIPKHFGLRHRAALGITQESDALAIVVSEETGNITAAIGGQFRHKLNAEQLEALLTEREERRTKRNRKKAKTTNNADTQKPNNTSDT